MFKIRKYKKSDIAAISEIMKKTFLKCNKNDSSDEAVNRFLADLDISDGSGNLHKKLLHRTVFVAVMDDRVVGLVSGKGSWIGSLFVDHRYHKKGIGRKLVEEYENNFKKRGLKFITLRSSVYAVGFYQSIGFKKTTGLRNYKGYTIWPMKKTL
ncbi:hypothetical protein C0584_04915 [Candidatus Parcubacteria bacterium]|nr:MAG: hypothetical protein C0584_04915 [Candidatus Parcubacteria bacterium]